MCVQPVYSETPALPLSAKPALMWCACLHVRQHTFTLSVKQLTNTLCMGVHIGDREDGREKRSGRDGGGGETGEEQREDDRSSELAVHSAHLSTLE